MLRPPGLQAPSLTEFGKHLCAGCGAETTGIPVGGYCRACRVRRDRTAGRIAQRIAIATTIPVLAYAGWLIPRLPDFRIWVAVGVIISYVAVRRIAKFVALQWIK